MPIDYAVGGGERLYNDPITRRGNAPLSFYHLRRGAPFLAAETFPPHTRNSDLYIDEEEAENLLHTIEQELRRSSRGIWWRDQPTPGWISHQAYV